ncbi:MAG: reverse transcriptase/maturase family protein [Candidatus Sulfotelmatobacter sp.]
MARSYANLWPLVVSWENLVAAYRKCRRRKRYKRGAAEFDFNWESNLLSLRQELIDGSYRPGTYRNFYIVDPKPRKISAAPFRDRVLHHAVVRVLEPIYERRFIFDSYACRRGNGTHRAIVRAQQLLRRYNYCLQTDIVRFFPNVDHQVLLQLLGRIVRDWRLHALVSIIIESGRCVLEEEASHCYFPGDDLFAASRPKGLPIGNLTSQFFANVLLDQIDHFVKEQLRVSGYVRYADDLLLFGSSKAELWRMRDELVKRLAALRLCLHGDKTQVRPCRCGVKFLGFILQRSGRRLQQSAWRRFNSRLKHLKWEWGHGMASSQTVRQSLQAWHAHTSEINSRGMQKMVMLRLCFRRN